MLDQESKGRPDRVSKGKLMDGDFPEHQITAGKYVTLFGYLTQSGSLYMLAKGKGQAPRQSGTGGVDTYQELLLPEQS